MNFKKFLVLVFGVLINLVPSQADPASPGVRPPPNSCAWTITYTIRPGMPASHIPKTEEVRKMGALATANRVFADNTKEKVWIAEGIAFVSVNGQKPHAVNMESVNAVEDPFISSLFFGRCYTGLTWIKPDDKPIEITGHQGQIIRYYRGSGTPNPTPLDANDLPDLHKASKSTQEAWIDAGTGLPIAFIQGGAMGVYRHDSAPSTELSLPPEFAKSLRYYNGYKD